MAEAEKPDKERHVYELNTFRKLDLVIYKEDGLEYDEHGCFNCIATCRKPVFTSGELVTGYLLVRPTRKIAITGFSVTFGGRYQTSWTEGVQHWSSNFVFFRESRPVIKNRAIALDEKWYRFDFEYQLPKGLPNSIKEPEGRVTYFAYGSIERHTEPEIDTHDTHFNVSSVIDIDKFPLRFHIPYEKRRKKSYISDLYANSEQEISDRLSESSSADEEEPHVLATLCLAKRAFVTGQKVISEVTVENRTAMNLLCTLRFEQVFIFDAHTVREYCGKGRPPICHSEINSKATRKNISKPSVVKLGAGAAEAFNCIFHVPDIVPSTPENYYLAYAQQLHQREPIIKIKYYVTLILSAPWMEEELSMPTEIKLGACDSLARNTLSRDISSPQALRYLTGTPNSEAPPGYEEPYQSSV